MTREEAANRYTELMLDTMEQVRSNTAMTMPSKIWAGEAKRGYGEWQDVTDGIPTPTPYIRADIAEELARALEEHMGYFEFPDQKAMQALAKYHQAIDTKEPS